MAYSLIEFSALFTILLAISIKQSCCVCPANLDDIILSKSITRGKDECALLCRESPQCGEYKVSGVECIGCSSQDDQGFKNSARIKGCNSVGQCVVCPKNTLVGEIEASVSDQTEIILSESCAFEKGGGNAEIIEASYNIRNARAVRVVGNSQVLDGRIYSERNLKIDGPISFESQNDEELPASVIFNGSSLEIQGGFVTEADVGVVISLVKGANISITGVRSQEFSVALAHVDGNVNINDCDDSPVLLQELEGDKLDGSINCPILNLTELLQLFGEEFEVRFFNDGLDQYDYSQPLTALEYAGIICLLLLAGLIIVHADLVFSIARVLKQSRFSKNKHA